MNLRAAIQRHEDLAAAFARIGKAKMARRHLLRACELKLVRQLKRESRLYRQLEDSVGAEA